MHFAHTAFIPMSMLLISLLLLIVVVVEGKPIMKQNATTPSSSSSSSPWLKRVAEFRPTGCWKRPWICNQGEFPPRIKRLCCRNRCVDVTSNVNNCGLCGIRCPFTWQCCRGFCINTNISPFHCGKCNHRCPFRSFCVYGMCGYAQPIPFPFPFPPKPFPPKPFPPKPHPPHRPDQPPTKGGALQPPPPLPHAMG